MLIEEVTLRLNELASTFSGRQRGSLTFDDAVNLVRFAEDFSETNMLIRDAHFMLDQDMEPQLIENGIVAKDTPAKMKTIYSLKDKCFGHWLKKS